MFFAYNVFPCRILRGKKTSSTHWLQERKKGRKKEKLHFNICYNWSRTVSSQLEPPSATTIRRRKKEKHLHFNVCATDVLIFTQTGRLVVWPQPVIWECRTPASPPQWPPSIIDKKAYHSQLWVFYCLFNSGSTPSIHSGDTIKWAKCCRLR